MIDLNDEILIDFIAEASDYYQTVQEAIEMMNSGQTNDAVAMMLRPLHTIKGTSGFIAGMDKLKTYTHRVEDFLKGLQAGEVPDQEATREAVVRAVDEVFNLLDQVKNGQAELDDGEAQVVLAELSRVGQGGAQAESTRWFPPRVITGGPGSGSSGKQGQLGVEIKGGVVFVKVEMARLHLAWQCEALTQAVAQADPSLPVVIDLARVRTISSTAWGEIWEAGQGRLVSLVGMSPAVHATYSAWGLDVSMRSYPNESSFWQEQGQGSGAGSQ